MHANVSIANACPPDGVRLQCERVLGQVLCIGTQSTCGGTDAITHVFDKSQVSRSYDYSRFYTSSSYVLRYPDFASYILLLVHIYDFHSLSAS